MKEALSGAALSLCLAAPAMAADVRIPVKAPPAPMAVYGWTGCYIGAQVGGQWVKDREREYVDATGLPNGNGFKFDHSGVVGGGHLGCTWQSRAWVFGGEVDVEGSSVEGGYRYPNGDGTDFRSRVQGSARLRLGRAVDRTVFYATGGLAWANLEYIDVTGGGIRESHRRTEVGWTVGGGIEHALTGNWTARVEYRFTDYGRARDNSVVAFPAFSYEHEPQFHTLRGYLTYRWGGPVVARY